MTVRRTRIEMLSSAEKFDGPPKTDTGYRTVAIPPHVRPLINEHLAKYAGEDRGFVDRRDEPMRGDSLRQAFERARTEQGRRTCGSTTFVTPVRPWPAAGANMTDLMRRLGHSSMAAAERYLHASESRDQLIAKALSALASAAAQVEDKVADR